ncbi:MAG: hypothetical protein R3F61_00555 [Myxococcota bacterium]
MKPAARQLMRALRGSASQSAFSAQLGYRSNVAAEWEGGRRFPNATELVRVCEAVGVDVLAALRDLSPVAAPHVRPDDLGPWLDALRGPMPQSILARRTNRSRHQIRRWLSGTAVPRLPDFLTLVEALTLRPATFVGKLVDLEQIPALRTRLAAERERIRFLAHQREAPVRAGLVAAGLEPASVLVVPLGAAGLPALLELHAGLQNSVEKVAVHSGEPDAVAVLAVGTARLG